MKRSPKRYDVTVKLITEADPATMARLTAGRPVEVLTMPDREMPATELRVDTLMRVRDRGHEYLLAVEFQTRRDPRLGHRLFHYLAAAHRRHGLPVRILG